MKKSLLTKTMIKKALKEQERRDKRNLIITHLLETTGNITKIANLLERR
jgi:hypothetical protein